MARPCLLVDVDVEGSCVEVYCADIQPDPALPDLVRLIGPELMDGVLFPLKDGKKMKAAFWSVRRSSVIQVMGGVLITPAPPAQEIPAPIVPAPAEPPPAAPGPEPAQPAAGGKRRPPARPARKKG